MSEIIGIGIDIVEIKRFRDKPYLKNKQFYKKIFLDSEIKYCLKFKSSAEHFAGKFAIKEAIKKSLDKNIDFLNIKTYHIKSKPNVKLDNKKNNYNFMCSISHEKQYAIGFVIMLKNN
jgi:holo-[acyl-carrier protein] synthase